MKTGLAGICLFYVATGAWGHETIALPNPPQDANARSSAPSVLKKDNGTTILTFEGIPNLGPVGTREGVVFGPAWLGLIDEDALGSGNFANEPSPDTGVFYLNASSLRETRISLPQPVDEISFFYTRDTREGTGEVFIYDVSDNLIATANLAACGSQFCGNDCQGDPNGVFCQFTFFQLQFPGMAALEFDTGMLNRFGIDDFSFTIGEEDPLPDLARPSFVDESNFYITERGELGCFFPDPNSDGSDPTGNELLHYVVTLEDLANCEILFGPAEIFGGGNSQNQWPQTIALPGELLPTEPYFIGISRRTGSSIGKRASESDKTIVSGPSLGDTDPATTLREIRRWLPHIPRPVGGFESIIEINNPNTLDDATVLLTGFDSNGDVVATRTRVVPSGQVRRYAMYSVGPSNLYNNVEGSIFAAFTNNISHIGIWERTKSTNVRLLYIAGNTQYAAPVDEYVLEGAISGVEFELQSSIPNNSYFDGVAVVNLTSDLTPEIVIVRTTPGGAQDEFSLGDLPPGSKRLAVLSTSFLGFVPYSTYTIESRTASGSAPIQILGLSGQSPGVFFHALPLIRKK